MCTFSDSIRDAHVWRRSCSRISGLTKIRRDDEWNYEKAGNAADKLKEHRSYSVRKAIQFAR